MSVLMSVAGGCKELLSYSPQASILILLASVGTVCLLRPQIIVRFLQGRYRKSRLARMQLFADQVFEPWYPILVRFWGLVIWGFLAAVIVGIVDIIR